jgi:hypothetical protein
MGCANHLQEGPEREQSRRPPSVILSAAKDLHLARREILRYAQDDSRSEVRTYRACPTLAHTHFT